jgi:hypothetical protein
VVRRSNGTLRGEGDGWRLFFEIGPGDYYPATEYAYCPFDTAAEAIAYGEREYGETAEEVDS